MIGVVFDDFPSISKGNGAWIALGSITHLSATVIVINYQRSTTSQNALGLIDDVTQIFRIIPNYY
jgi:hypothetical protein